MPAPSSECTRVKSRKAPAKRVISPVGRIRGGARFKVLFERYLAFICRPKGYYASKVSSSRRRPCSCWVSPLSRGIISSSSSTTQNIRVACIQHRHCRTPIEFAASCAELDLQRISQALQSFQEASSLGKRQR
jgi:hypothetical protein